MCKHTIEDHSRAKSNIEAHVRANEILVTWYQDIKDEKGIKFYTKRLNDFKKQLKGFE